MALLPNAIQTTTALIQHKHTHGTCPARFFYFTFLTCTGTLLHIFIHHIRSTTSLRTHFDRTQLRLVPTDWKRKWSNRQSQVWVWWVKRGGSRCVAGLCARWKRKGKETCRTSFVEDRLCGIGTVVGVIASEIRAAFWSQEKIVNNDRNPDV